MPRSKWKIPYTHPSILNQFSLLYGLSETIYCKDPYNEFPRKHQNRKSATIHTFSRNSTIPSFLVGTLIHIHNGKKYFSIRIKPTMVGKKLGEFSPTRKVLTHKKTKKK